jgi:hypothetical protein
MFVKTLGVDGKSSSILDNVKGCIFHQRSDAPGWWATITEMDGGVQQVMVEAGEKVYVMNEYGDTVHHFTPPSAHA